MKKIISNHNKPKDIITLDKVYSSFIEENEFIVYERKGSNTVKANPNKWCILRKIESKGLLNKGEHRFIWGFVSLIGYITTSPTYQSYTGNESIKKCIESGREVLAFKDIHEFYHYYTSH